MNIWWDGWMDKWMDDSDNWMHGMDGCTDGWISEWITG